MKCPHVEWHWEETSTYNYILRYRVCDGCGRHFDQEILKK